MSFNSRQASGVGVNPQCLEVYQALKLKKTYKYIIFGLSKDFTEIVVEKTSDSQSYDDFIGELPETECRWAIYDFEFEKEEGGKRTKLCFFSWYVLSNNLRDAILSYLWRAGARHWVSYLLRR